MSIELRNIAIIAHVDHGKTTLVDAMLRQGGVFRTGEEVRDRVMDSGDLERERGITIMAKQASLVYRTEAGQDVRINIIDTPGHADFGGEVERTLRMADGVILLVDAAEGALPQTRFVLGKAIELAMTVIVVVNKIDRQDARPDEALDEVFGLFCDLGASDDQADFSVLYAIGKDGVAMRGLDDPKESLKPLFETIIEKVPAPNGNPDADFQFLVHHTDQDDYVGRLAIGRVHAGRLTEGSQVDLLHAEGKSQHKVANIWGYEGMKRVKRPEAHAGDIVAISGIEQVQIGDTLATVGSGAALPRISIEEPTLKVQFLVNTSPLAGRAGKFVTSRHLRERLEKEAKRNLALRVEDTEDADRFLVLGRGELMISVLAETLRREGYELALAMPEVVVREVDGGKQEPVELVVIDVPDEHVGAITTELGQRRGQMTKMGKLGESRTRLEFRIPARGLIGFRSLFMTLTRGTGLLNTLFDGWEPWSGPMLRRKNGAIVSDRAGVTTPYALFNIQPRGVLFIGSGTQVYEGMVVGEHNRASDLDVNVTKEKKLTNIRAAGKDDNVVLAPPRTLTIETAMEFIDQDELVEITPDAVRVRKRELSCNRRPKRASLD